MRKKNLLHDFWDFFPAPCFLEFCSKKKLRLIKGYDYLFPIKHGFIEQAKTKGNTSRIFFPGFAI